MRPLRPAWVDTGRKSTTGKVGSRVGLQCQQLALYNVLSQYNPCAQAECSGARTWSLTTRWTLACVRQRASMSENVRYARGVSR